MPALDLKKQKFIDNGALEFPQGLIGFFAEKRFSLVDEPASRRFRWLRSEDRQDLSFLVVDPRVFVTDYAFEVSKEDLTFLGLHSLEEADVLAIVTAYGHPLKATMNLESPILINGETRRGKQIVLEQGHYPLQYTILRPSSAR